MSNLFRRSRRARTRDARGTEFIVDRVRRHAEDTNLHRGRCRLGGCRLCVSRGCCSGAAKPGKPAPAGLRLFQPPFAAVELVSDPARDILVNARRNAEPSRRG